MCSLEQLYNAIDNNDDEIASALLKRQPALAHSRERTPPPIHWAIFQDKPEMVETLLEHGADIDQKDQDRNATPLDYAIIYGRTMIIPVLLENGACLEDGRRLALRAANGEFEEFSELPSRHTYAEVVTLLQGF